MNTPDLSSLYSLFTVSINSIFKKATAFIFYFWLHCVLFAVWAFLRLQEQGLLCRGSVWASLIAERGLWGAWASAVAACGSGVSAPRLRAQAQQLWHGSLVVPWHLGSFWIRDGTCVFCTGREILYRWATWEALLCLLLIFYIYVYEFFPLYHMLCSQWYCSVCSLSFWCDSHLNHNTIFPLLLKSIHSCLSFSFCNLSSLSFCTGGFSLILQKWLLH